METSHGPEVLFCDLCNASVPQGDLDGGLAVRDGQRTIGACCVEAWRLAAPEAPPAVGSQPWASAAATPAAATSAGALAGGASAPEARPWIALAGAFVAAIGIGFFLDYRIGQLQAQWLEAHGQLAAANQGQSELLQELSLRSDSAAGRADLDGLTVRLETALTQSQDQLSERLLGLGQEMARTQGRLEALQQDVAQLGRGQVDYGPALVDLRQQLQRQAVLLADLAAQPRPKDDVDVMRPVDPAMGAPSNPDAAVAGLPPELAHQVGRLGDSDEGVRFEAADELLRSKDPRVLASLLPMAKDSDTFVRRLVIEGLRDFVRHDVVEALLVALADPEEIVRDSAWRSLKAVTGQSLPFEAGAAKEARSKAQQRWQDWWQKAKPAFGS